MALYRFLFAPVLLAVAVIAGPRGGAERPPRAAAVVAPAPAVETRPVSASLVVPRRAGRAEPPRLDAPR